MIQVWLIDDNGFYQNESKFVEEVKENMTTIPMMVGYVRSRFNKETKEWYEGATQEEINQWIETVNYEVTNKISLEDEIVILKQQNKLLNDAISELSIIISSNL